MSDGSIKISTILDSNQAKKGLQEVEKAADNTGKKITDSMNKAEKSMIKASGAFDGAKIAKQLNNVSKSIDDTSKKITQQQDKLSKLQKAYESAGNQKLKDNISAQIEKTTANIDKLETKLNGFKNKEIDIKVKMDSINDLDGNFRSASVKITDELDKVEKKAEQTGKKINDSLKVKSLEETGKSIQKVGDSISGVGDKMTTNLSLPIVGVGIAAAKVGMDFDSAMSRVKAISGATGEDFTKLKNQAIDLGASTAFSAKEAASGMENLASAGFSTTEIMTAMPGMLDLAASSGEDLATSADIAASTLRGFGLDAGQAGHVADVLAKNAGATNAAVRDTGEAMKFVAPVAKAMGWSIEEVTAAIGEMANAGIKGSQSGTTLRSAVTSLVKPSDAAAGAMEEMGFKAFDSQGKMLPLKDLIADLKETTKGMTDEQKQNTIATIFGQEAMSGMLTLIDAGPDQLDQLTQSYKNSDGAAKDMATTMQDNAKSAVEQMVGSMETAAIKVEESFAPTITNIANAIGDLADKFAQLSPEQQDFYVKLLLGIAAAGPLLKTVGGITNGIGGLVGLLGKLAPGLGSATVAAEGMAEAGAAAAGAGGLGALAPTLGGLAVAAAPYIIAAAAIGTAGYAIYDSLNQEVIPSVDLFGDKVETVGETVQTEYGAMTNVVEVNTTKISDATKQAVQSYLDMDNNAKEAIQDLYINNSTITDQIVTDTKTKFDEMTKAVVGGYEKQKNDSISQLTDLFSQEQGLTAEEQASILEKTNKYYADKETNTQNNEDKINEIIKTAKDNNKALTAEQVQEITDLQNQMRDNAVNALSDQETEAAIILQRMKDYDGQITAEQASEHIKALNDSRDQAVQTANDEYDQKIATITKMRDETKSITDEQAQIMIDNAKRQRDGTVAEAEKTRDGAVEKIKEMNTDIEKEVDLSTGNIKTYWDKLKEWWNSWNPPKKTLGYEIAGGSTTIGNDTSNMYRPYGTYTGTNSRKGLSYVNEHGYETAKDSNVSMISPGLAFIGSHATGGDGINDHMTTYNEMQNDINNSVNNKLGATVARLLSATGSQNQILKSINENTGESANSGLKNIELSEKLANNIVDGIKSNTSGNFSSLNNELTMASTTKDSASKLKVEDNSNYASLKNQVDDYKNSLDELNATIDNTTDSTTKKQLEAQKKVLQSKQDSIEKEMGLAKLVAENEIQSAKDSADQQVKIAEEKKDKLVNLTNAVTTAIKNQLQAEEDSAEGAINSKITKLTSSYNKKLADLEEETTQTSRQDTIDSANQNIDFLTNQMNNTASYADRQALALKIKNAQNDLNKQEDTWTTEDKKKALEDEYNNQKDTLEKQLSDTKDYYSKLQETDSINAQARYLLLNGNSQELVELLNSYNPQWQNVGQSLADSLLTGLNSEKESIQDAVSDLVNIRGGSSSNGDNSDSGTYTYYDTASQSTKIGHYATGTSSNPIAGLYKTNELGAEMSTKGDVAYVSKDAGIKSHMQTQDYINSLVNTKASLAYNSVMQSMQDTVKSMLGATSGANSNITHNNGNTIQFNVKDYHQYTGQDAEATANELGFYAFKQQS